MNTEDFNNYYQGLITNSTVKGFDLDAATKELESTTHLHLCSLNLTKEQLAKMAAQFFANAFRNSCGVKNMFELQKKISDDLFINAHWRSVLAQGIKQTKVDASIKARAKADKLHNKPNGTRAKRKKILEIWASGKYTSRDICAEQECAALDMSFSAARKALRNTPDPT